MRKIYLFIFLLIVLFLNACSKQTQQQSQQAIQKTVPTVPSEDVSKLTPEQVVVLYFQSWNDEQYDIMYSLVSDGFKQIEPTAKTFEEFKANMEKFYDTALGIRLIEAKETYNTGQEAGIDYKIEITNKDDTKKEFSSTYTLKKRANGWKLIHPYGENIDTS